MPKFPYIKTIYEKDELNCSSTSIQTDDETQSHEQNQTETQNPLPAVSMPMPPYNNTTATSQNPAFINDVDRTQFQQMYSVPSYHQPTEQVQYYSYPPVIPTRHIFPLQVPSVVNMSQSSFREPTSFASQGSLEYPNGILPPIYQRGIYTSAVFYSPAPRQQSLVRSGSTYPEMYSEENVTSKTQRSLTPAPPETVSAMMLSTPQRPSSTHIHRPVEMSTATIASPLNPMLSRRNHGGIHKASMIDAGTHRNIKLDFSKVSKLAYDISESMVIPPFKNLRPNKSALVAEKPKRSKRKSKFTPEQDKLIVRLKNENKTWVEIAEIAKVESYLTARNRYQVLIGQQGSSSHDFTEEDLDSLKQIVDEAEIEKMKHLSKEFRKCTGKLCTYKQVRELIRYMFWKDPEQFDIGPTYLQELNRLQRLREEERVKESIRTDDYDQIEETGPNQATIDQEEHNV